MVGLIVSQFSPCFSLCKCSEDGIRKSLSITERQIWLPNSEVETSFGNWKFWWGAYRLDEYMETCGLVAGCCFSKNSFFLFLTWHEGWKKEGNRRNEWKLQAEMTWKSASFMYYVHSSFFKLQCFIEGSLPRAPFNSLQLSSVQYELSYNESQSRKNSRFENKNESVRGNVKLFYSSFTISTNRVLSDCVPRKVLAHKRASNLATHLWSRD